MQAATVTLVGEMANASVARLSEARDTRSPYSSLREFLVERLEPDLGRLAESKSVEVRTATARSLGRILRATRIERKPAQTKALFEVLSKLFAFADVERDLLVEPHRATCHP